MSGASSTHESIANRTFRWGSILLAVVLVFLVGGAYWLKTRSAPVEAVGDATPETLMQAGVDALHVRNDPSAAAALFRKVLILNPTHYGAIYQLATALDRAGKPDEARPYWERLLPMAETVHDDATAAAARARLAKGTLPPEQALMNAGLDALYRAKDPSGAAVQFRKVLEVNPTHYGATYQLATALDRMGKPAEARALWENVLRMAEGYKDQQTLAAARARLARTP
jgi:cytochrome c-type biogenesis protein CcmH/NrfG